jgi:hypothetical protein
MFCNLSQLCGVAWCSNRVEVAYREAVALKRQEELIREEEAAGQAETELRAKRDAAEREKRSRKKQVWFLWRDEVRSLEVFQMKTSCNIF